MKKAILTCLLVFCLVLQGCAYNAGEKDNAIDENAEKATKSTTTTSKKREKVPVTGGNESGDFIVTYSFNNSVCRPGDTIKVRITAKNNTGHEIQYHGKSDVCPVSFLSLTTETGTIYLYEEIKDVPDEVSMDHTMSEDEIMVTDSVYKIPDDAKEGTYDFLVRMNEVGYRITFEDVIEIYK